MNYQDRTESLTICTDGGARGNPGPAAAAFVVIDSNKKLIFQKGIFLGKSTNNFAEYSAVVCALQWLQQNVSAGTKRKILFNLDSQLVVNQLNGIFKVKNSTIREMIFKVRSLEEQLKVAVTYRYIPRHLNFLADRLVNRTLDKETLSDL